MDLLDEFKNFCRDKGKYNIIGKSISIEFLKSRKISSDLEKENKKLRDEISKKLEEFN